MLKIAIIGTGNISHNHIQGYLQFADRCQVAALVDIYPEKAEEKNGITGSLTRRFTPVIRIFLMIRTLTFLTSARRRMCMPKSLLTR